MSHGVLPFQLSEEFSESGVTGLAGLPMYQELGHVLGLGKSVEKHLNVRSGKQGYTDVQFIIPLVLMNMAGGDCVADLAKLEDDPGFRRIAERVELSHLNRKERRELRKRWRKRKERLIPSASSVFRYLEHFCVDEEKTERGHGRAYIPPLSEGLLGLRKVNTDLLASVWSRTKETHVTLDLDATIKGVHKKDALFCYKGFKAYQPLNVWLSELELVVHSEFRDGNVPALFDNLRVTKEALEMLPEGVKEVSFRSDTAAYQKELLQFLAKGLHPKYGVIDFAIGAPMSAALKMEVKSLEEAAWKRLQVPHKKTGELIDTTYEYAEVAFVPNWVAACNTNPDYRFIVTREVVRQQILTETSGEEQLLLDMASDMAHLGGVQYKLYAMVTNKTDPGDEVIRWYRKRCGDSEQAHDVMKNELAGGQLPSNKFGVNAAWWQIMILSLNLNSAMKRLVLAPALGKQWLKKRLKAIRYQIICLPGRVVNHARLLRIKIGGAAALSRLRDIRTRIAALA